MRHQRKPAPAVFCAVAQATTLHSCRSACHSSSIDVCYSSVTQTWEEGRISNLKYQCVISGAAARHAVLLPAQHAEPRGFTTHLQPCKHNPQQYTVARSVPHALPSPRRWPPTPSPRPGCRQVRYQLQMHDLSSSCQL